MRHRLISNDYNIYMLNFSLSQLKDSQNKRLKFSTPPSAEVATASNPWPLRMDSHAPSSAGGARRGEAARLVDMEAAEPSREGTRGRRSRTSGESGRTAVHLPRTAHHATYSNAKT
ncbi:hypothetical protein K1T71_008386 [Dendrolimus kikuchii]|uniref:Uncharacterized protein n=1 Tax=Dendrolimus kikuchii TaxID=765133 RepID=A0ACC1CYK7_9NEOP|nr:hypothetical protein K1T71_008386 [Dendrolimus kikuchii]